MLLKVKRYSGFNSRSRSETGIALRERLEPVYFARRTGEGSRYGRDVAHVRSHIENDVSRFHVLFQVVAQDDIVRPGQHSAEIVVVEETQPLRFERHASVDLANPAARDVPAAATAFQSLFWRAAPDVRAPRLRRGGDKRSMVAKPIRVLLICASYPPVLGGSEIEAQRVSAAMIRSGHQVRVLCSGGPPMPPVRDWVDPAGVPVSILTRRSRGRWKDLAFTWEVASAIWKLRGSYDVVYFLMQGLHLAGGLPLAHFLKKPVLVKISGSNLIPLMRRSRAGRLELDWMQKWRVPVMILNEGMVQEALADGFTRDQLVWMPNPVDPDEFRPALPGEAEEWRENHGIPVDAKVAIYVGRLSQEKGIRGLIGGFAHAALAEPESVLVLVGGGAMLEELRQLVAERGVAPRQVRFVGPVPASEIPFWLRASDVFSLTSPNEGFPCALVEAMAAGLPSVVSDIPANLQLVDEGVHGLSVPFDEEEAIGRAFLTLFRDGDLRRRMGVAARQRVLDNYSTARIVERYETLFRSNL